jgi:hypothetical protein
MNRTWLSRIAQLLATPRKQSPSGRPSRLSFEALEDRSVPAVYTFDATAHTLLITLGTNEALSVTAGATNTKFALTGGTGTPVFTQNGGDPATSGDGTATITIANTGLTSSLTVNNTGAAASSSNDVTFAGGTVTSSKIAVSLTGSLGVSDRDDSDRDNSGRDDNSEKDDMPDKDDVSARSDIALSGSATLAGATNLSTANGSILVGASTAINAPAGDNITLTAGPALTIDGTLSTSGTGTISLTVGTSDPDADTRVGPSDSDSDEDASDGRSDSDADTRVGGTVIISSTATITSGTPVQITGGNRDNTFDLTAQAGAALSVNGGASIDSDSSLTVHGTVSTFTPNGPGGGTYTFTGGAQPITFTNIETLGPTVSVSATSGEDPGTNGSITFTRTGDTSQPLTVNFSINPHSTATLGTDYTLSAASGTTLTFNPTTGTGIVTFAAGSSTATLTVNVIETPVAERTETVIVNVGTSSLGLYTPSPFAGTATVFLVGHSNDDNGQGDDNNQGNEDSDNRTRTRPAFGGAFVLGDQMFLLNADGQVKSIVPVTRGTQVAFSDLTGNGVGDVVMSSPLGVLVLDGQTGNVLAVFFNSHSGRGPDVLLFSPTTGAPQAVFFSRVGEWFSLS